MLQRQKGQIRWLAAAALVALLAACAAPAAPAAPSGAAAPTSAAVNQAAQATTTSAQAAQATQDREAEDAASAADDARAANAAATAAPTETVPPRPAQPAPQPAVPAPSATAPSATLAPAATEPVIVQPEAPSGNGAAVMTPVPTTAPTVAPTTALTTAPTMAATTAAESSSAAEVTPTTEATPAPPSAAIVVPAVTPTEMLTEMPTVRPVETQAASAAPAESLPAPEAIVVVTSTKATTESLAISRAQVVTSEARIVELEWPPEMRLGDSDIVRIALVPSVNGYTVTTEFPGNTTVTRTVEVERPQNYEVFAVGQLDGAGFEISPAAEWSKALLPGQLVDWRWTIRPNAAGQHRLALVLKLRWVPTGVPADQVADQTREADLFTKGMTVQVSSVMGLGLSTAQASSTGLVGLLIGSGLGLFGLAFRRAPQIKATLAQVVNPNASLKIEPHAKMQLAGDEIALLRTLFAKYDRIVLENEFRSGYSGARTFLVHPIHADGRADAFTIAKMGSRASIQREFDNYQRFVKDTLPPITARIQEPPVTAPAPLNRDDKAVLRYTFIGEQGRMPVSLREALLAEPETGSALLRKLFETFGPNWWMQRKPYVFRLAQEYDRMLPAHFVIEPVAANAISGAKRMDGRKPAEQDTYRIGDVVALQHFPTSGVELRADGRSLSLKGEAAAGQPPLRLRWLDADLAQTRRFANGAFGRIVGTRETLLREWVTGPETADLHGLPDPIAKLPRLLGERVQGTQSTIHGDLNLENGLVGPGGFVWLIDFAETRDGHALYDFAHLEAEIIAHVIAPSEPDAGRFVAQLQAGAYSLLQEMHQMAAKCLFNPSQMREYELALGVTCLGATKYGNLTAHQQHLLFLTAANLFAKL